jgi:hypothetical protein
MADPVSWLMIEPGWRVVAADGEDVGRVEEVVGDSSHDIWDGLGVASGILARPQYVAAEQVAEIVDGQIRLSLTKEQFRHLGEYEQPPTTAEIEPEAESVLGRAESAVETPTRERPGHVPFVRRILLWLGLKRD